MKLHEALARALAEHEIHTMFGLIGDANMFLVHSFVQHQDHTYIGAAHEAGAMFMASDTRASPGDSVSSPSPMDPH